MYLGARSCITRKVKTSILYVMRYGTGGNGQPVKRYQHRRDVEEFSVPLLCSYMGVDYSLPPRILPPFPSRSFSISMLGAATEVRTVLCRLSVCVEYETSPGSTALQWLQAAQTAGKQHPYLFSQCQVTTHCFHSYTLVT